MKRTSQRTRADRAFSAYIRNRDGCCQACGSTEFLQCAHVWSRRYYAVRWDERNAVALCRACHTKYTHNPALWDQWCEIHVPEYRQLRALAIGEHPKPDLLEIARHYEGALT